MRRYGRRFIHLLPPLVRVEGHGTTYPSYPPPQILPHTPPITPRGGLQANSGGVSRVGALPLPQVRVRTEACARLARAVPKTGTPRRSTSQFLFYSEASAVSGSAYPRPHMTTAIQAALPLAPNYAPNRTSRHKAFFISRLTTAVRSATNTPEWLILSALDRFRGLLVGTLFLSLHVRIGVRRAPRQGVRPDFR